MEKRDALEPPPICDRDWSSLAFSDQLYHLEVEGFLLIPDMLSAEHVAQLKAETARFETFPMDYSIHQRDRRLHPGPNPYPGSDWKPYRFGDQGGAITELIAYPPTVQFLERVFGDDVVFMTYEYARSEPGHPGISLHTDGQPYGSSTFGYECSCPVMIKVLYYLDDLTPDISPFSVFPRSHLSLHADGNPYTRYETHPDLVMVTATAGSALLLHPRVFHGTYPNVGRMVQVGYRPAWAGPVKEEVPEWEPRDHAKLPDSVKPLFADRNTRKASFEQANKPNDMTSTAPGISPHRWKHDQEPTD